MSSLNPTRPSAIDRHIARLERRRGRGKRVFVVLCLMGFTFFAGYTLATIQEMKRDDQALDRAIAEADKAMSDLEAKHGITD
jgi:hypothetical protein